MPTKKNNFKPNYSYTFGFILFAIFLTSIFLLIIDMSFSIQALMTYIPLFFHMTAWIVCVPLVRSYFTIVVENDGLTGPLGIVPYYAGRTHMFWSEINQIEIVHYFLFTFIIAINSQKEKKIYIPLGIDYLNDFSLLIRKLSPPSCPLRLVFEQQIQQMDNLNATNVQLSGRCIDISRNEHLPLQMIQCKKDQIIVFETKTDAKGRFFFEANLIPGTYSFSLKTKEYVGEARVDIKKSFYKDIVIQVKKENLFL